MTETERALIVAAIAAGAAVSAALIAATAAYLASLRERRRVLYGEAFRAALGWTEMLYRVRRRSGNDDQTIVERFHTLQESLTYYEGWMLSESKYMARSYRRLVKAVKTEAEPMIRTAWSGKSVAPGKYDHDMLPAPDVTAASERFMKDVRGYLSPLQFRKIAVVWRNRESAPKA